MAKFDGFDCRFKGEILLNPQLLTVIPQVEHHGFLLFHDCHDVCSVEHVHTGNWFFELVHKSAKVLGI